MSPEPISVVIPVYNGADTLPACLAALQQQTRPPDEVIVVDDGSTDGTVRVAERFGVRVLRQANAGPAAARNHGVDAARGTLILFTDADCVPTPAWVEQMAAPFAEPSVMGAKGEYRTEQPELVARFVQQEYQDRYDRMRGQAQIDFIDTYAAAYRRDVFIDTDGFDTSFPTASVEDQEYSFRLVEQGHRLVYVPGAIVYHRHDRSLGDYVRRKYGIGYWKAWVTRRHPGKLARDSHTPQVLKLQMVLAGLGGLLLATGLLGRKPGWRRAGWLSWLGLVVSGIPFYRKVVERDPVVLSIAPALLFVRAWALGLGFLLGNLTLMWRKQQ